MGRTSGGADQGSRALVAGALLVLAAVTLILLRVGEPARSPPTAPSTPAVASPAAPDPAVDPVDARREVAPAAVAASSDRAPGNCRLHGSVVAAGTRVPIRGAGVRVRGGVADGVTIVIRSTPAANDDVTVRSGDDGSFAVDVPLTGGHVWRLDCTHPDWQPARSRSLTIPFGRDSFALGELALRPLVAVRVRVTSAGMPMAGVGVFAAGRDPARENAIDPLDLASPAARTDADGNAVLRSPRAPLVRVYAAAEHRRVAWTDITLDAGEAEPPPATIDLGPESRTVSSVTAPPGTVADARISLTSPGGHFELCTAFPVGREVAVPDPWGNGKVMVVVRAATDMQTFSANAWLERPADGRLQIDLRPFQRDLEVQWAVEPETTPVVVTLCQLRRMLTEEVGGEVTDVAAAVGRARLRPKGRESVRVAGFHPRHGIAVSGPVPEGGSAQPVELDWQRAVVAAAPLAVQVTDASGRPCTETQVAVDAVLPVEVWPSWDGKAGRLHFATFTDAVGEARFAGLPCVAVDVRASQRGCACASTTGLPIRPGENRVQLQLRASARLAVELRADDAARAMLGDVVVAVQQGTGGPQAEAVADADGVAWLGDLASGRATVRARVAGERVGSAFGWWDPYGMNGMQWVTLAAAETALQPGDNRCTLSLSAGGSAPSLTIAGAAVPGPARVALTRVLPNGRPSEAPRSRSVPWPAGGLRIAGLMTGTYVLELLVGDESRAWMTVDCDNAPLTRSWPGTSERSAIEAQLGAPIQECTPWHARGALSWLRQSPPDSRIVDGSYRLRLAGAEPLRTVAIHDGRVRDLAPR